MTNADLEKLVDTSDEWITSRTGIKERRIARDMETSDMAVEACRKALEMAETKGEEIDVLVAATVTPDYRLPSLGCVIQEKLNLPNAVAFDVVSACAGFINGLTIANAYIESGNYKKVMVVGVEKLSTFINYKDRNTCILFGDGAGAAIFAPSQNGRGVLSTFMKSDGSMREMLWSKSGAASFPVTDKFAFDGTDKIMMNGSDLFKVAVKEMTNASNEVMKKAGIDSSELSIVIPHQANIRIVEAVAKRLKVDMSKVFLNIEKYGNTSAASVPLALDEANREGRIKDGDYVLMVAFGGGLIWGAALVKW